MYTSATATLNLNLVFTIKPFIQDTEQIGFFEDFDELYYNAIGGDWAFSIESASSRLSSLQGSVVFRRPHIQLCGSTGCDCALTEKRKCGKPFHYKAFAASGAAYHCSGMAKGVCFPPFGNGKAFTFP